MTEIVPSALKNEFKDALFNGHLSLNYQPIVDIRTGYLVGFEALMRWTHPEKGAISPGVFIPIAEETGLIVDASKWALKEACRALKRIEGRIGQNKNLFMSVNFSARDFAEESFLEDLYNIISASDVQPGQIQLEINRQLLSKEPETARSTLLLCHKAGLKIALDDYVGDDALTMLDNFSLHTVKIDNVALKQQMSTEDGQAQIGHLIKAARSKGLSVIAERVETKAEVQTLRELGCTAAQGFYFTKPLPEREITELMLSPSIFTNKVNELI
jgi:EAL domain-containing protein (putative c-di-GMP-specific phosphodiesterase class I)